MNDLTTSLLLICAATTFAAGLVVAQRRLVANIARRFLALPRVEQAPLVVAVGVMTVCAQKSGTNGVSNAEKTESQRRGEEESTVQSGSGLQAASQEEGDALNEGGSGVSPLQQEEVNVLSRSGQETASTLKVSVTTNDIARGYAFVEARTNAKVTFTGDGASNLADPTFIAKAGETNRVTLLIGKSYQATCAFPFEIVGRSSTSIEVSRPSDRAADVCWPVKISVGGQNSSGAANAVALASDAAIVNATVGAKIKYAGQAPSGAADDVVVRGTFAEAGGEGEPIESEATLTSVRVSLTAQYAAPENACASRHVYGVGERVKFLTEPALDNVSLKVVKFDSDDYVTTYDTFDGEREVSGASERVYTCPATASQPNIRIVCRQALYMPAMTIVEPQFVKTPEASGVGSFSLGDVGMGSLVTKNYIGPMTVSFQGVQVFEVPCTNAVAPSGYFATTNYTGEWSHTIDAGAGWAHLVKENNYWMTDSAGREVPYSNWSEGLLAWKIPVGWRRILPGSESSVGALKCDYAIYGNENSRPLLVGNSESAYHQVFEIDANGKSSVTKFGWRLERSRWSFSGDVSNLDKEVR